MLKKILIAFMGTSFFTLNLAAADTREDQETIDWDMPPADDSDSFLRIAASFAPPDDDVISIEKDNFNDLVDKLNRLHQEGAIIALGVGRTNSERVFNDGRVWVHMDNANKKHQKDMLYFNADFNTQRELLKKLPRVFSFIQFDVRVVRYIDEGKVEEVVNVLKQALLHHGTLKIELTCFNMFHEWDDNCNDIDNHYPYRGKISKSILDAGMDAALKNPDYIQKEKDFNPSFGNGEKLDPPEQFIRKCLANTQYTQLLEKRIGKAKTFLEIHFSTVKVYVDQKYYDKERDHAEQDPYETDYFVCENPKL